MYCIATVSELSSQRNKTPSLRSTAKTSFNCPWEPCNEVRVHTVYTSEINTRMYHTQDIVHSVYWMYNRPPPTPSHPTKREVVPPHILPRSWRNHPPSFLECNGWIFFSMFFFLVQPPAGSSRVSQCLGGGVLPNCLLKIQNSQSVNQQFHARHGSGLVRQRKVYMPESMSVGGLLGDGTPSGGTTRAG